MRRELLLLCVVFEATTASAEMKGIAVSVLVDSPGRFVAPIVLLSIPDASDGELRLGQWGWTTAVDLKRAISPGWTFVAGAELTPWHAHASNLIYDSGERAPERDFIDTAAELRLGVRRRDGESLTSEWNVMVDKEWLANVAVASSEMWRSAYAGLELRETLEMLRSDDPYRSRFDGLKISALVRGYVGRVPYWRGALSASAGRKLGPAFIRLSVLGVRASLSNPVAQWLVGGSWDTLGTEALFGHPYAEYRISTGAVVNTGVDLRIAGDWEAGLRAGLLATSDGRLHHGEALQLSTILSGLMFYAAVGFPDAVFSRPAFYAGAAAAWALP